MMNFFQLNKTVVGEAYFRVSEHLHEPISKVIKNKFHPDYKLLLNKYFNIIIAEQKQYEEMEEMRRNMPSIPNSRSIRR